MFGMGGGGAKVLVKFLGDKTQISQTIGSVKKEADELGTATGGFGGKAAVAATGALALGTALFHMANKAGEAADHLFDLQDQTGISTDKLQEMQYVAGQAGVDVDFYSNAVKEVIKAQDELQKGTGPAAEALDRLNVSVQNADGSMRSAEAITDETITRLGQIEDPTLRAALAQDVFKRKYEDLLPVLGMGADKLADARDEAHKLGVVQSREALTNANEYRKGMEKLQAAVQGLVNEILQNLLPVIVDHLIPALEGLIGIVAKVVEGWQILIGWLSAGEGWDEAQQRMEEMGVGVDETAGKFDLFKTNLQNLPFQDAASGFGDIEQAADDAAGGIDNVTQALLDQAEEIRKAADPAFALRKAGDELDAAKQKVRELEGALPRGQPDVGLPTQPTRDYLDALDDLLQKQADFDYAQAEFDAAGKTPIGTLYNLGEEADVARGKIDLLIERLDILANSGGVSIPVTVEIDDHLVQGDLNNIIKKYTSEANRPLL